MSTLRELATRIWNEAEKPKEQICDSELAKNDLANEVYDYVCKRVIDEIPKHARHRQPVLELAICLPRIVSISQTKEVRALAENPFFRNRIHNFLNENKLRHYFQTFKRDHLFDAILPTSPPNVLLHIEVTPHHDENFGVRKYNFYTRNFDPINQE